MVLRRAGDAFGSSFAFPGGVIDPDDSDAHRYADGKTEDEANKTLGLPAGALDYYSAAIREVFEETGVLIARDADGNWAEVTDEIQKLRIEVDKGRLPWIEFLREQELRLAYDALHYFAYWETPYDQPKRWRTRFFLAELPDGQRAAHDGSEVIDHCWFTAKDALAGNRDRSIVMPFPTYRNLKNLAKSSSFDELVDWAHAEVQNGIIKLRPVLISKNGKEKWVVKGDSGYIPDDPV